MDEGDLLWYFGSNYEQFLALAPGSLGVREIAPVGQLINTVAERISRELLELDQRLMSGKFTMSWAASDIAERSPMTSDLYLDACRAIALMEAAKAGGRHVVVVEDRGLGRALARMGRRAGLAVRREPGGDTTRVNIRARLTGLRVHLGFLRDWWRLRSALGRHPVAPTALAGCAPWLMSWIDGRNAERGPPARDRFLGDLPGWLRQSGLRIGWLGNPAPWITSIENVAAEAARRRSQDPCVLVSALFGVGSLLRAYLRFLAMPFALRRGLVLAGVDVTPLVRRALARVMASPRLVSAALYAGLARTLKRRGLEPKVIVYTYENQPWEKAMLLGFRSVLPSTMLIGVQHAPLAEKYLAGHPSTGQWRDGSAPDLLLTIGTEFRERLIALGAPADRVQVGGALRFDGMLASAVDRPVRASQQQLLVLATCSMDPLDSFELVHKAAVATVGIDRLRLAINVHPMVAADFSTTIRDRLSRLVDCQHVDFVEGSAVDWLGRADMLLYNSSSTVFEAAAMDVPAIYVGSSLGLDIDAMSGPGILRCRESHELRRHIEALLNDHELRRRSIEAARAHLRHCFAVPDADFWTGLVQRTMSGAPR